MWKAKIISGSYGLYACVYDQALNDLLYCIIYIYDLYRSFLATYGLRCLKKMILHSSLENHSPLLRLQPCRRTRHHTSVKELNKHRPDTKVARPSSDRILVVQDRTNTARLQTHITELNYIESIQMFFH